MVQTYQKHSQEWQLTRATGKLEALLDDAKRQYGSKLIVTEETVDITEAFYRKSHQRWGAPRNWGDVGGEVAVVGYAAKGTDGVPPLAGKYNPPEPGKARLEFRHFDRTAQWVAMLCLKGMHNTSLFEVYEPIKKWGVPVVQGFTREVIDNIVNRLQQAYGSFNPDIDSFFMFAAPREAAVDRAHLNQLWLSQILQHGSKAPHMMDTKEADLFERVMGKEWLGPLLRDFRWYNISSGLEAVKYSGGWNVRGRKDPPFEEYFAFWKTVAYVKEKGIKPTIYCGMTVVEGQTNYGFFPLEPEEVGVVINKFGATPTIVARKPVKPFSFKQK